MLQVMAYVLSPLPSVLHMHEFSGVASYRDANLKDLTPRDRGSGKLFFDHFCLAHAFEHFPSSLMASRSQFSQSLDLFCCQVLLLPSPVAESLFPSDYEHLSKPLSAVNTNSWVFLRRAPAMLSFLTSFDLVFQAPVFLALALCLPLVQSCKVMVYELV